MYVAAGGFVHLREWSDTYRDVPASAPGALVVRIGFPLNAAASVLLVVALAVVVWRRSRLTQPVILATIALQVASLGVLIGTRVDSVLGWSEPVWTIAADQTRAVEIAAIVTLLLLAASHRRDDGRSRRAHQPRHEEGALSPSGSPTSGAAAAAPG